MQLDENTLACTYATLILHDENLPITSANIQKLVTVSLTLSVLRDSPASSGLKQRASWYGGGQVGVKQVQVLRNAGLRKPGSVGCGTWIGQREIGQKGWCASVLGVLVGRV